ncbi:hypothetical protein HDV57DRAFT_352857 [Trichoderma longibrachiatum]|uniref:Uncharacterized protein n=1 Tax=Trichoderma longibrachiatum ATCC 18648 TaxID=983965 RepID=A0A2T4BRF4_TRILO|nr:hypothetical protein M440DRAFT_206797 [Trichoderma longibrachiatum ATCC 18648]
MHSEKDNSPSRKYSTEKQEIRGTAGVISVVVVDSHPTESLNRTRGAATRNNTGETSQRKDRHQQARRSSPCLTSPTTNNTPFHHHNRPSSLTHSCSLSSIISLSISPDARAHSTRIPKLHIPSLASHLRKTQHAQASSLLLQTNTLPPGHGYPCPFSSHMGPVIVLCCAVRSSRPLKKQHSTPSAARLLRPSSPDLLPQSGAFA